MNTSFTKKLKIVSDKQDETKARKIDAYKSFVHEAIPGYIVFMEILNQVITRLEDEQLIGKTKLKSRIKAINSSITNTDEKVLDDIFGFEIVTQSERDKEILMLLIHNLFAQQHIRQKNHNKSNGYYAHHCTGTVKKNLDGNELENLEKHILEAETSELKMEYRDLPHKEQKKFKKEEIFCKKPRYPILREEIVGKEKVDSKLRESFKWAIEFIEQSLNEQPETRKGIPIMEMQFKTEKVEQEAKYGKAQHVKYKKVNEDEIIKAYYNRKLVRGVDFPFAFVRNNAGNMEIEHSNETLVSMWPFLDSPISEYHQTHSGPVKNYDMYFAKVFPELEVYVQKNVSREPHISADGYNSEMAWGILKNKIINNSFILPETDERTVNVK